jgi:hypothetical protein
MYIRNPLTQFNVILIGALLCASALCEDAPKAEPTAKIVIVTLNDGKVVKCVKLLKAVVNEQTIYTGVTLEGKRAEYTDEDVKSTTTETVVISTLPEIAQKTLAKYAEKKAAPADNTPPAAAAPVTAAAPADAGKTAATINPLIADEKKKYDAAVEAIMDEGRKAVDLQNTLDDAAKKVDAKAAAIDAEYDAADRGLCAPNVSKADKAAWEAKLKTAASRKAALLPEKTQADSAAATQDKKVADLVASKDKKLAALKTEFDEKCKAIKAKYDKDASGDSKTATDAKPAASDAKPAATDTKAASTEVKPSNASDKAGKDSKPAPDSMK